MSFEQYLFPAYEPICLKLMATMQKVAFLILMSGLMIGVHRHRHDLFANLAGPLLSSIILTALIGFWPELLKTDGLLWSVGRGLSDEVGQDIKTVAWNKLTDFISQNKTGWWDLATNARAAFAAALASILGWLGLGIVWIARMFQFYFIGLSLAFGPVFLSLFALPATRAIGTRFVFGVISLFLWDLSWRLVDVGTANLISMVTSSASLLTFGPITFVIVLGWVILGYIFAPLVVTKALVSGGNPGEALTHAVHSGAFRVATTAAGLGFAGAQLMAANNASAAKTANGSAMAAATEQASAPVDRSIPAPPSVLPMPSESASTSGATTAKGGSISPIKPAHPGEKKTIGSFVYTQDSPEQFSITTAEGTRTYSGNINSPGATQYAAIKENIIAQRKNLNELS